MAVSVRNVSQKFGSVYTSFKTVSSSRNYFTYTNEPAQPIQGKSPKWVTAEEAFQDMKSGNIFINIKLFIDLKEIDNLYTRFTDIVN